MSDRNELLLEMIRLVHTLEATRPYVTAAGLRRAAREQSGSSTLAGAIGRLVNRAVRMEALYSDNRLELTPAGRFRPIRIYRVNWRHALVQQALDGEDTWPREESCVPSR
jgi:hypothetical protein